MHGAQVSGGRSVSISPPPLPPLPTSLLPTSPRPPLLPFPSFPPSFPPSSQASGAGVVVCFETGSYDFSTHIASAAAASGLFKITVSFGSVRREREGGSTGGREGMGIGCRV